MVSHHTIINPFSRQLSSPRHLLFKISILRNNRHQRLQLFSRRTIASRSQPTANEPYAPGDKLCGESGRTYIIQEVLAERRKPLLCVYRASAEGQNFIVKNMIPGEYEYQQELQKPLASCPYVRTVIDGLPGPELFIFPFLETDLLQFAQRDLTTATRRSILKSALLGLAALHDRNILHSDIKPNNILLDYKIINDKFSPESVQISDLEDAAAVPAGKSIIGGLLGNQMWRSPESWAQAKQGPPSDIFSFGVVAIYIVLKHMILRVSEEELVPSDSWRYVLRRILCHFGEDEDFKGLLEWIGEDNEFFMRLIAIAETFDSENPRRPAKNWVDVDPLFRDLICKMTILDPRKRVTARKALEHPWFTQSDETLIDLTHITV